MNENVTNALDDINKSEVDHGKDSLHVIDDKEKEAVAKGNKTTGEIARIMSPDEILFAASDNPIYVNMVFPCLAANISLNDRIFKYFEEPVAPAELNDRLTAVMLVLVNEVSKEKNGIVFFDDGTLDFRGSLEQCAMMGTQPIPFLSSSMSDAELSRYKYQMENEIVRHGILQSAGTSNYSKNIMEEVFAKSVTSFRIARNTPDYTYFAGKANLTKEDKAKMKSRKEEINQELERISAEIRDLNEQRKQYPPDSQEYKDLTQKMKGYVIQKHELYKERAIIGNPENDTLEEISAKGLATKMFIFGAMGVSREMLVELGTISRNIRKNGTIEEKEALENETFAKIIQKNVIDKVAKDDGELLRTLKDRNSRGELTQESKDKFLVEALKTYIVFNNFTGKLGSNIFDRDSSASLVRYAKECIIDLVPEFMSEHGNLDYDKLAMYVQKIPGYDNVTMDNFTAVLIDEKAQEIGEIVEEIERSGERELLKSKEQDAMEFIDGLTEEAKLDTLVNGYNIIKAFTDLGVQSHLTKILKMKLERNNFGQVVEKADAKYKETEPFLQEQIYRQKTSYYEEKFKSFNVYSRYQRTKFTNEEIGSYLSAAISAYDNTRGETEQYGEIRKNAVKIIGIYLPDAIDDDGNVNEDKLLEEYKKFVSEGKYALMPKDETVQGMFNYHNVTTLEKIQKDIVKSYLATIERIKENDKLITNEEARDAVDKKGEQLNVSSPVVSSKGKNTEVINPISEADAKKVVDEKGVEMRVGKPQEQGKNTKKLEDSTDKRKEEQGNALVDDTNNSTDGDTTGSGSTNKSMTPSEEKKGVIGFVVKAFNYIKSLITNASKEKKEKEEDVQVETDEQGIEDKKNQEKEKDKNQLVEPATLDIEAAQVTNTPNERSTSEVGQEK